MPSITLQNPTIQQKETSALKTYYLIKDSNNPNERSLLSLPSKDGEAFFAFEWTVKEGWQELVNNYQNIKELELEKDFIKSPLWIVNNSLYFENNSYKKITSLYIPQAGEIIL